MVLRVHPLRYVLDYPAASSIFPNAKTAGASAGKSHSSCTGRSSAWCTSLQESEAFKKPTTSCTTGTTMVYFVLKCESTQSNFFFCIWLGVTLVKIIQNLNGSKCDIPNIAKSVGLAHPFQHSRDQSPFRGAVWDCRHHHPGDFSQEAVFEFWG